MPAHLSPEESQQRERRTHDLVCQLVRWGLLTPHSQTMSWDVAYGRYTWNVPAAQALVAHTPHRLRVTPTHQLAHLADIATVDAAHVQRVDPTQPGIVGMYFDLAEGGWRAIIIDGNHRAVRAFQTGVTFSCYELTPVESWALLLEHPYMGESIFYAQHLTCTADCMISVDAEHEPALV